jgi:Cof subfamily protein (haloacid dehalogenase superfamily)
VTRRIAFIDIDGTLMSEWGVITPVARAALRDARRAGHLIYICTGRTEVELTELLQGVEYDGIVGAGGCFVEIDGTLAWRSCFPPDTLAAILAVLDQAGLAYYEQAPTALFPDATALPNLTRRIDAYLEGDHTAEVRHGLDEFLSWFRPGEDLLRDDVYKIVFLGGHGLPLEDLRARFGTLTDVIDSSIPLFGPDSGELLQPGMTKATGMAWLLDHLGLDQSASIALGDSANDIEMLRFAGVGIAMANASPAALAAADEVTASVVDEGVAKALHRHGLIAARP